MGGLPGRHFGVAEELGIGLVDDTEYLGAEFLDVFFVAQAAHGQVVALGNQFGHAFVLLRDVGRHLDNLFYPVNGLFKSQLLKDAGIVVVVVEGAHGVEFVKTLNQRAFGVKVRKAQRALYLFHAVGASKGLYLLQQLAGDFGIVNKVNPPEAYHLDIPFLVGLAVDDGCYASYHLAVTFGQMFIGHADLSFYHKQISSVTFLMHTIFDGSFRIEVSHREPGILFDGGRCLAVR